MDNNTNQNQRITIASARRAHELGLDADYLACKARAARAAAESLRRRAAVAFAYLDGRAPVDAAHHYTEREYCYLTAEYRRADVVAERTEEAAALAMLKASTLARAVALTCDADAMAVL